MDAPRRLLRAAATWPAAAALLALIFALSSLPNVADPHPAALPLDKVAHAGEYAALSFALAGALRRRARERALLRLLAAAVALAALYGATDEFHQRFITGRDPALSDWLADLVGSVAGALASAIFLRPGEFGQARTVVGQGP